MNAKNALERSFLAEIMAIYPDFPSGAIVETERPDFLVSGESHITGIEVVRYLRGQDKDRGGSADLRNETLRQQIADEARREFEFSHTDPLMVYFLWHSDRYLRKADVPDIAAGAANLVEQYILQTLFARTRIAGNQLMDTALLVFVSSISVTRVRNKQQALWSSIDAGFVSVSASELQELMASKYAKVSDYLQRCAEVWLLIVAYGGHISSTAELPEDIRQASFRSQFHRILFYDRPNERITILTG
jgi:hypothetical protein